MVSVNTVVNAFAYRALVLMEKIAAVADQPDDAADFKARANQLRMTAQSAFLDTERYVLVDGEGSSHASLHANAFAVALGLIEPGPTVSDYILSKGMACSVYAAQYLLEALYMLGRGENALSLLTSESDRSWLNMIRVGSTITTEAWDMRYKQNQDWNHAWGAAPANIIPRFLLGVRPLTPGYSKILIKPALGTLAFASGVIPTIRGPIRVRYSHWNIGGFQADIELPGNTEATVVLSENFGVAGLLDGRQISFPYINGYPTIPSLGPGRHTIITR